MLTRTFKPKPLASVLRLVLLASLGMVPAAGFPRHARAATPAIDLVAAINQYRQQQGLPAIPMSSKLNAVAVAHVQDLATYHPENNCGGNLHSWSSNGNWKGGCYNLSDQSTWPIMWNKPQEIAGYPSYGYENSASSVSSAQAALQVWKNSAQHNAVILNQGMWAGYTWKAIGAACHGGYACVWFGTDLDNSSSVLKVADPERNTIHGQAILKDIQWDRVKRKR